MSTETRLKPCPFCGGAARELNRFNANVITCRGCGVKVRQSEMGQGDAAEQWNKRFAPVSAELVALPQCPFPCGWSGLHKIAVQDAAYLAKVQWPEDEEGVSVPRATAMRSMDYLIQVCRAMLNTAPVAAQAQQYVSGGSLADRLDALADTAPPGSQMQSDLYAAATIWRKHLKGPAVQQPVSGADGLPASPTQGMTLGQRIAHVGGRENAQGYVEFGSPMAVNALIQHVLRDFHRQGRVNLAPAQKDANKVDAEPDMFWDADNPEQCQDSIHNLLVEVQCDRTLRVGDIVEIQQAMSLPNISVRVTAVDTDGDLEYETVNEAAVDAARKENSNA